MGVKKPQKDGEKEETADEVFIDLVRAAMTEALRGAGELKEKNALFANCIKFIAVTNKLKGEDGDWFNE